MILSLLLAHLHFYYMGQLIQAKGVSENRT
ncbi:hypothetical protein PAMA111031_08230 [Paraphotobacterium marinum]